MRGIPSLIIKSLFYQGNYNTENMQGTGFAWLARPILKNRGITLSEEEDKQLNGYFNTNPSFVTLILGIFIKECKDGDRAFMAKNAYSSAFAALGDSFFWHALRPILCLVALFICLFITPWGIAVYPVMYSAFHVFFLFFGGLLGSILGLDTITVFNRFGFKHWADLADKASVFILGALIVKGIKYTENISEYDNKVIIAVAFLAFMAGLAAFIKIPRYIAFLLLIASLLMVLVAVGGYNLWILL